ncbi:MAG: sulfotransferase [Chloroflexi bacterium]|nr:sulfotransferase [Chloroflexota bacterium]
MPEHFIIAGAQRSGTTYLYHLLSEHPEIEMARPLRPEPKFFMSDAQFEQGKLFYENRFFTGKPGAWLRGEKSASYIESEKTARRIAIWFPQAPIIFVLRDPIERAISNYWFSVNNGLETLPMAQAFMSENERLHDYDHARISVSPFAYLARGRYINYITVYERYFPKKQIILLLFEQMVGSAEQIGALFAQLGVKANFLPTALQQKANPSDKHDTTLSPELEEYLHDYFAESNHLLVKRFGLDISQWRQPH